MKRTTPPGWRIQKPTAPAHEFAMRFTSTPRGARLARRLVSHHLDEWGYPYDSRLNETATLITAELAANAVRHGRVQGRDFHLRLSWTTEGVRLEVSDTRTERLPELRPPQDPADDESGRGLLLVEALADRWGVEPRSPGKCVWAECALKTTDCHLTGRQAQRRQRSR